MNITIHIDTATETVSEQDKAVLLALAGVQSAQATVLEAKPTRTRRAAKPVQPTLEEADEDEDDEDEAEEPAPKPTRTRRAAKAKPEPVEADEDDDEDDEAPTVDAAVKFAAELVSEGRSDEIKEVLATFGVKRVSLLKPSQVAKFIAALED